MKARIYSLVMRLVLPVIKLGATHYFFYSSNQHKVSISHGCVSLPQFKGKPYTEMRGFKHGWSNWDDAILIGYGGMNDVTKLATHDNELLFWPEDIDRAKFFNFNNK